MMAAHGHQQCSVLSREAEAPSRIVQVRIRRSGPQREGPEKRKEPLAPKRRRSLQRTIVSLFYLRLYAAFNTIIWQSRSVTLKNSRQRKTKRLHESFHEKEAFATWDGQLNKSSWPSSLNMVHVWCMQRPSAPGQSR